MNSHNNNSRRESWEFWKEMIRFIYEYDLNEDGFWRYNETESKKAKAKQRWRDWRNGSILDNDELYLKNLKLLIEEFRDGGEQEWSTVKEDGSVKCEEFGKRQCELQGKAYKRNKKEVYKYEKSIGLNNSEFAERRRQRRAA